MRKKMLRAKTLNVVKFPTAIKKQSEVYLPYSTNERDFFTCSISDDSLKGDGVLKGYRLVCRYSDSIDNVSNNQIAIIELPNSKLVVRHILFVGSEIVLRSSNPAYSDLFSNRKDVKIKGVVIQAVIDLEGGEDEEKT